MDTVMESSLKSELEKHDLTESTKKMVTMTLKCLSRSVLSEAFKLKNVQEGFQLSGVSPFDPLAVLENIRGWKAQDEAVKKFLVDIIPTISELAK